MEAILLLHGQPGSGRDWARVIALLDPDAQTLAPDRPGWDGASAPAGLAVNGRAAIAALDRGGVERATVVGHSFGGAVAACRSRERDSCRSPAPDTCSRSFVPSRWPR